MTSIACKMLWHTPLATAAKRRHTKRANGHFRLWKPSIRIHSNYICPISSDLLKPSTNSATTMLRWDEKKETPMQSLTLRSRIGKDGILKLETAIGMPNTDVEVVLVVNPLKKSRKIKSAPAKGNWPEGFFEKTFGSIPDFPLRESQG